MLPLGLQAPPNRRLTLLTVGAHADDIEIGAGGTLLSLCQELPLQVRYVVLTGTKQRHEEARHAAHAFMGSADPIIDLYNLPDGRLPTAWDQVKEALENVAHECSPDIIIGPSSQDAHQDHRTVGEILPTVFRDGLYLGYEIPKWDGDISRPSVYLPLSGETARTKVQLLHKCFPSQERRDWWDDEVFLGLARLRGVECRARYAEAFFCTKSVVVPLHQSLASTSSLATST